MALQSIDTGGEFLPVGLLDSPSGSPQEGGAGPFARDAMAQSHDADGTLFGSIDTNDSSGDGLSLTSSTSALLPQHSIPLLSGSNNSGNSGSALSLPVDEVLAGNFLHRASSAPPTIQEDDDIDGQAVDPAYYAYYYSNRRLDPRMPPPSAASVAWSAWQQPGAGPAPDNNNDAAADGKANAAAASGAAAPKNGAPVVSPFSMIQSDFPTTPSSVFGTNPNEWAASLAAAAAAADDEEQSANKARGSDATKTDAHAQPKQYQPPLRVADGDVNGSVREPAKYAPPSKNDADAAATVSASSSSSVNTSDVQQHTAQSAADAAKPAASHPVKLSTAAPAAPQQQQQQQQSQQQQQQQSPPAAAQQSKPVVTQQTSPQQHASQPLEQHKQQQQPPEQQTQAQQQQQKSQPAQQQPQQPVQQKPVQQNQPHSVQNVSQPQQQQAQQQAQQQQQQQQQPQSQQPQPQLQQQSNDVEQPALVGGALLHVAKTVPKQQVAVAAPSTPRTPVRGPGGEDLSCYPWYQHDVNRDMAERTLMDRPTGSFLVRPSSQPNCFRASDHQILTNHGFMFLDQVLAHIKVDQHNKIDWCGLLVANFDKDSEQLVYEQPQCLVVCDAVQDLIEMQSVSGDDGDDTIDFHLVTTLDHDMYAAINAGGDTTATRAATSRFAKLSARALHELDDFSSVCWKAVASNGVKHVVDDAENRSNNSNSSIISSNNITDTSNIGKKAKSTMSRTKQQSSRNSEGQRRALVVGAVLTPLIQPKHTKPSLFAMKTPFGRSERSRGHDIVDAVRLSSSLKLLPRMAPPLRSLSTLPNAQSALLRLFGFWLVRDDSRRTTRTLRMRCKASSLSNDVELCRRLLHSLALDNVLSVCNSNNDEMQLVIAHTMLRRCFVGNDSRVARRRDGRLPAWVWSLRSTSELRSVVDGMLCASECAQGAERSVSVRGEQRRDDVLRLLLHAGVSARFVRASASSTSRWTVLFSDAPRHCQPTLLKVSSSGATAATRSAPRLVTRTLRQQCHTWCFDMRRGFVVVRRAIRTSRTSPSIVAASRATIQGNCLALSHRAAEFGGVGHMLLRYYNRVDRKGYSKEDEQETYATVVDLLHSLPLTFDDDDDAAAADTTAANQLPQTLDEPIVDTETQNIIDDMKRFF